MTTTPPKGAVLCTRASDYFINCPVWHSIFGAGKIKRIFSDGVMEGIFRIGITTILPSSGNTYKLANASAKKPKPKPRRKSLAQVLYETAIRLDRRDYSRSVALPWRFAKSGGDGRLFRALARRARKELVK